MGRQFSTYFTFILLTVGLLIGGVVMGITFRQEQRDISTLKTAYIQQVQSRLSYNLKQLQDYTQDIGKKFQQKGKELDLSIEGTSPAPFFIFRNGKLVQWSDYRFVPDFTAIQGDYDFRLFRFHNGYAVVHKKELSQEKDSITLVSLLRLSTHYKIENAYLPSALSEQIFTTQQVVIAPEKSPNSFNLTAPDGQHLFSLVFTQDFVPTDIGRLWLLLVLTGMSFLLAGLALWRINTLLHQRRSFELAGFLWTVYLVALRATMLYSNFPFGWFGWDLFNPNLYPSSPVTPSLGDLGLNILTAGLLILYALRYYPHTQTYKLILELSLRWKVALAGLAAFLSFWAMQGYFNALGTIFLHPEQRLAIALTFQWNTLNWFGFVMFVALSVLYFFVSHSLARLFIQFGTDNKQKDLVILLIAGVLFTGITYWFKIFAPWLLLLNGLYFSALYVLKLPKLLPRLQYSTSIYFFLSAVICALVSTYAIYSFGAKKSLKEKKAFATRLLPENDAIAETQLGEAIPIIQKDTLLLKLFADSTQSTEQARQWIRRAYLGNYFHKYEVRIHFFEAMVGKEIGAENTDTLTYNDFTEKYKKIWYDTPNSAIRFIDQGVNIVKRYVVFVKMNEGEQELGNIVLDLRQRAGSEGKVYPELLVNQNFIPSPLTKHYSYAVYDDDLPAYQVGKFNFEKDFNTRWFEQDDLFLSSWVHNGMEHLAVSGGFNKKVVVASPSYAFYDIYANFSFFFLLLILFIVMILVIYSIRHRISRLKPNFATRIQIYLNIAFFLPLFTVSWITWSVIGTTYKQDLENNFIQQTEGVARNLQEHLENYQNHKITKENLTQQLNQIAQNVEVDINVFDQNGYLITSSQSAIYENDGLISKYLNPMAWRELVQNKNQKVLLRESVGKLSFQTAYIPLKTYIKERRRQLLGVVGVPFFDAQNELDRKRMEILSLIINIFASVFMAFVIFSYFASQMLTVPLRLITAQIRKTTFNNYSEPLVWNSQDEIGLFVQEYNKMLRKLDRSKDELAQIQRENAWREIAQQVAHEIKNPLTPMKLSIQMMQVRLQNQSENVRMMFERSIDTLLTQIDILSDIATSFSSFAKMPIPVSERFEITEVLRDTQNLYSNEEVELIFDIAPGKFFIRGDRKLLGRIFTNLIKNALEAMPEDRPAQIIVRLTQEVEGLVLVEFKDNGAGVPADVQDKIFMPNFTTKSSGSGIGLAVAKRGIDHAGGRIWFETEDDKGTSFFIELPLVE